MTDRPFNRTQFSEAEAERILDRVIELDRSRATMIDEADLRAVAVELGVAPELVDRAVAEVTGPIRSAPRARGWARRLLRAGAVVMGMGLIGAATIAPISIFGTSFRLLSVVSVGTLSVLLGLDSRIRRPFLNYALRNAGLWAGMFLALDSVSGFSIRPDLTMAVIIGAPMACGMFMLVFGRWIERADARALPPGGGGSRGSGRGLRIRRTVLRWAQSWLDRVERPVRASAFRWPSVVTPR